jgi:hypothetical protein
MTHNTVRLWCFRNQTLDSLAPFLECHIFLTSNIDFKNDNYRKPVFSLGLNTVQKDHFLTLEQFNVISNETNDDFCKLEQVNLLICI